MSDSEELNQNPSSPPIVLTTTSSNSNPNVFNDPNEEIWIEFLNSLHQKIPEANTEEKNSEQSETNEEKLVENSPATAADNDDATDDPDFTVSLENCDLEDPYFPDACFQVPKKEAVELVKDAIEICDGAPIVYEDQRNSKVKSAITIKKLNTEKRTKILINRVTKLTGSMQPKVVRSSKKVDTSTKNDYVPEFTEIQKKQLDEQLRNHVQLLTQTCLVTYCSKEHGHLFDEAQNLLNILKGLNQNDDSSKEDVVEVVETDEANTDQNMVKLTNLNILNLNEALEIISNIKEMPNEELTKDLKHGVPSKFLEIILTSPVFYNTSLVPNLSRFKYQSQFKKAQFTDTEKILLIMGFNKFKHLPKSECCECIKEHLLPIRTCDDIRKQLNNFSSSEQRQRQLKELLKRQRQVKTNWMHNYNFIKEVHYICPYEQADHVQLPSQYTIMLERIKLANVLKDTKKSAQDRAADNDKENEQQNRRSLLTQHIKNFEAIIIEEELNPPEPAKSPEIPLMSNFHKIRPKITKVTGKRGRSTSKENDKNSDNSDIIILDDKCTSKESSPILINLSHDQTNNKAPVTNNILPASFLLPTSNLGNLGNFFSNQLSMINPTFIRPIGQNLTPVQQIPMLPQSAPIILPANFNGTVLISPTIHIHTNTKNNNMEKFCKIKPKDKKADVSPAKKKKN